MRGRGGLCVKGTPTVRAMVRTESVAQLWVGARHESSDCFLFGNQESGGRKYII